MSSKGGRPHGIRAQEIRQADTDPHGNRAQRRAAAAKGVTRTPPAWLRPAGSPPRRAPSSVVPTSSTAPHTTIGGGGTDVDHPGARPTTVSGGEPSDSDTDG